MKIFTIEYNLNKPVAHRITVPQNSPYGVAVKVTLNGEVQTGATVTVGGASLDSTIGDWPYAVFTAGQDVGQTLVPVVVGLDGYSDKTLPLYVTVADEGGFTVDLSGGGGATDAYTKTETDELLSAKADVSALTAFVTSDDLTAYQPAGEYLSAVPDTYKTYSDTKSSLSADGYATGPQVAAAIQECAPLTALTAYQEKSDMTAYYTASQTSSNAEISTALTAKADTDALTAYQTTSDMTAYIDKATYPTELTLSGTYSDSTTFNYKVAAAVVS